MTLSESFQTNKVPSTFPSEFPSLVEEEQVITSNENENEKVPTATVQKVEVYPTLIELGLKAEVPASDIAELKKLRLEQKIREEIRDVDRLEEMIREKVRVVL